MSSDKIVSFTDLVAWKEGHKLVVSVYTITKQFPREELYSLVDQMRRAASSITANIAEGFGRRSYKEKQQFYYQAQGSLLELINFVILSKDIGYLTESQRTELLSKTEYTHRLLQGLIQKTKTYILKT